MKNDDEYGYMTYLGVPIIDLVDSGMFLTDLDIMYSYVTYFIEDMPSLTDLAEKLVKNKICDVIYHSFGYICWENNKKIEKSLIRDNPVFEIINKKIHGIENLNEYAKECTYQAAWMRHFEIEELGEAYLESFLYIRGYMSACYFEFNGRRVVYPQIKIYHNGVVIISFRGMAPKIDYPLDAFVQNYINLPLQKIQNIQTSPELYKISNRSYYLQIDNLFNNGIKGIKNRYKTWKSIEEMDKIIDNSTIKLNEIDFSFNVVPLDCYQIKDFIFHQTLNLDLLMDMISRALSNLLNDNDIGVKHVLFGKKKDKIQGGHIWRGRQSIYILNFQGQPENSKIILQKYRGELSKIMYGVTTPIDNAVDDDILENNLRFKLFDDYSIHMNIARTLWVSSKKDYSRIIDINRGDVIYNKQILEESISFIRASHDRQYERAVDPHISYRSLLKEQLTLVRMDNLTDNTGHSGEINNFHNSASVIFNLSKCVSKHPNL